MKTQSSVERTTPSPSSGVPLADLATPEQLAEQFPGVLSAPGVRWLIRQRHRNGLVQAGAVLIVRNRALIVRSRFENWLGQQVA